MNPERQQIIEFLQNSDDNEIHSYVAEHSLHQSFSDSEAWFPSPIAKRVYNRGKKEARHATIRGVVDAWGKMLAGKTTIVENDSVLKPFSYQPEADKHATFLEAETTESSSVTAAS